MRERVTLDMILMIVRTSAVSAAAPEGGDVRQPKKVLKQWIAAVWIAAVNDEGRKLTDWEVQFMESITEQFDNSGSLSEKQEEILERIYTEKVP